MEQQANDGIKKGCGMLLAMWAANFTMSAIYGAITLALWSEHAPSDWPRIGFWSAWGAWVLFSAATMPFRAAASAAVRGDK